MATIGISQAPRAFDTMNEALRRGIETLRGKVSRSISLLLDDPRSYYILLPSILGSAVYLLSGDLGVGLRTSIIVGLPIAGVILYSSGKEREK